MKMKNIRSARSKEKTEKRGRNTCDFGKQSCEVGVIAKAQTMRNLFDRGFRID